MADEPSSPIELFVKVLSLEHAEAAALVASGHTTLEEIAYVPLDELLEVPGVEREVLLSARRKANEHLLRTLFRK